MDESVIRGSVLFFLVTIDNEKVYPAAELALTTARRRKFSNPSESLYSLVIRESVHIYRTKRYRSLGGTRPLEVENLPSTHLLEELSAIKEKISEKLLISFVWNEVVKAPLADIARGLNETEGSVEQRSYEVLKKWMSVE